MAKKKKRKSKNWWIEPEPIIDNKGDLRFFQRSWYQRGYFGEKKIASTQNLLQQYDGKDWRDIPSDYEDIYIPRNT